MVEFNDSKEEMMRLYDVSHTAKQQARAMRVRLDRAETERKELEAAKERIRRDEEALIARTKLKNELDDRVRTALIRANQQMKLAGVVFKGPESSFTSKPYMPKFQIVDVKTGKVVDIRVNATGFEWD